MIATLHDQTVELASAGQRILAIAVLHADGAVLRHDDLRDDHCFIDPQPPTASIVTAAAGFIVGMRFHLLSRPGGQVVHWLQKFSSLISRN